MVCFEAGSTELWEHPKPPRVMFKTGWFVVGSPEASGALPEAPETPSVEVRSNVPKAFRKPLRTKLSPTLTVGSSGAPGETPNPDLCRKTTVREAAPGPTRGRGAKAKVKNALGFSFIKLAVTPRRPLQDLPSQQKAIHPSGRFRPAQNQCIQNQGTGRPD